MRAKVNEISQRPIELTKEEINLEALRAGFHQTVGFMFDLSYDPNELRDDFLLKSFGAYAASPSFSQLTADEQFDELLKFREVYGILSSVQDLADLFNREPDSTIFTKQQISQIINSISA